MRAQRSWFIALVKLRFVDEEAHVIRGTWRARVRASIEYNSIISLEHKSLINTFEAFA